MIMSEVNSTILRQAFNKVFMEGYVKKMELESKVNDKGKTSIRGSITIMTAPGEDHNIDVFVPQLTKKDEINKAYVGIQTVMNEFVSMGSLMQSGKTQQEAMNECTKVRITSGQLSRNEYAGQNGQLVSRPSISCNYFSSLKDDEFHPGTRFEVEGYIEKIQDEMKDGDDTGRKLVTLIVPVYGGKVYPMNFVVGADLGAAFEDAYEVGQTAHFNGEIIDVAVVSTSNRGGFGRANEERTFIHEWRILGGDPAYGENDTRSFSPEAIRAAMTVRETETIPAILARKSNAAPAAPAAPVVTADEASKFRI